MDGWTSVLSLCICESSTKGIFVFDGCSTPSTRNCLAGLFVKALYVSVNGLRQTDTSSRYSYLGRYKDYSSAETLYRFIVGDKGYGYQASQFQFHPDAHREYSLNIRYSNTFEVVCECLFRHSSLFGKR